MATAEQTREGAAPGPEAGGDADGVDLSTIVDLASYPIDRPDDPALAETVARVRADLEAEGCARIAGFVRPEAQAALTRETEARVPDTHYIDQPFTPYGTDAKPGYPEGHPQRRLQTSTNGVVAGDQIPEDTTIKRLYRDPTFQRFVAACLDKPVVHPFADPMRNCIVNVMPEGAQFAWHFDANEFIVSLMTKPPESGGLFEYCPNIRGPGDENYEGIQAVLDGDMSRVRGLYLGVGDLQLFKGRYSLHRVGPPKGGERHCVLLGYSESPGYIGPVESTLRGYGRVTQAHIDAEAERHDDGLAG